MPRIDSGNLCSHLWEDSKFMKRLHALICVLLAIFGELSFSGCTSSELNCAPRMDNHQQAGSLAGNVGLDESTDTSLLALFSKIRAGSSEAEVSGVLRRAFVEVGSDSFWENDPFKYLLPQVNSGAVSEWRSLAVQADGWPQIVFAVYETTNKLTLVDALWYKNGDIRPIVDGLYNRNLRSIKSGDSIERVYQVLGKRQCSYFRAEDSRWHVRFSYWAYQGHAYVIEADAADGKVLSAGDGTL
jgi:hypothetical protein